MRQSPLSKGRAFLLCTCLAAGAACAENRRPVLIMGTSYGRHERQAWISEVLEPGNVAFRDGGDYVPAAEWPKYGLVILCDRAEPLAQPGEVAGAQRFVAAGGHLLLVGSALYPLRAIPAEEMAWVGAHGYGFGATGQVTVAADAPSAPGAERETVGAWFASGGFFPRTLLTATPMISIGKKAVAFTHRHGEGQVLFVGREFFRLRTAERRRKAAGKPVSGDACRDWLAALVRQAAPLTRPGLIQRELTRTGQHGPQVWFREPGHRARGAAYFAEPYPLPGETLEGLQLDVCRGEYESFPVYLSTPVDDPEFTVTVSELTCGDASIPGDTFRVRIQGLARKDLTVGTYWLLDGRRHGAETRFTLDANHTYTLWFTMDAAPGRSATAGTYRGTIRFGDASIPLEVTLWDVRLPGPEYLESRATFMWNSLGADPRKARPDATLDYTVFDRHMDNLAKHHCDYNSDVYWSMFLIDNARLRRDGRPLKDAVSAGDVDVDNLPRLDLTVYNHFMDAAVARGMPHMHMMLKDRSGDWLGWARRISRDPKLAPDSPLHRTVKDWLTDECVGYVRERGVRRIVSFLADEIPPTEIPDVVRRSGLPRKHGVKTAVTLTGLTGKRREHAVALREACDVWTWNLCILQDARRYVAAQPDTIKPGDLQYCYTADWHHAPYVRNRERGPFWAWNGLDGWHVHGYLRWYPNGGAVFGGPNGPIDTEGWEGVRDGIEDGRLLARTLHLCRKLRGHAGAAAIVAKTRSAIHEVIAENDAALIRLKRHRRRIGQIDADYLSPASTLVDLRKAKRLVLEHLALLEPFDRSCPIVTYGDRVLVRDGRITVAVEGPDKPAQAIRQRLAELAAPHEIKPGQPVARIILTHRAANTAPATLVHPGELGITSRYPAAGDFVIVDTARGDVPATLVYGGDEAGLQRGVAQLRCLFLKDTR